MSTTPTLRRPPSTPPEGRTTPTTGRRLLVVAMVLAATVAAVVLAFALGLFEVGTDTDTGAPPVVEPDDAQPDPTTPDDPTAPDRDTAGPTDDPDAPAPSPTIRYGEELRANWDVTGVASGDVLNVRAGPGTTFPVVAALGPDAAELESTGRIARVDGQLWREVVVPGDGVGWVNAAFLIETAPPAATIRYGEELRANWDVTGVAADDVLNVRSGPGTTFEVVATLEPDAAELESTGRIARVDGQLWREVVVPGDGVGWVNAAYLEPTT